MSLIFSTFFGRDIFENWLFLCFFFFRACYVGSINDYTKLNCIVTASMKPLQLHWIQALFQDQVTADGLQPVHREPGPVRSDDDAGHADVGGQLVLPAARRLAGGLQPLRAVRLHRRHRLRHQQRRHRLRPLQVGATRRRRNVVEKRSRIQATAT